MEGRVMLRGTPLSCSLCLRFRSIDVGTQSKRSHGGRIYRICSRILCQRVSWDSCQQSGW